MKRFLKIFGLVILVLLIVAVGAIGSAFVGRQAITDGFEINGIRIVKDGIVSVAVVPIAPGEVALIDAGIDKTGKAILAELSRRQLSPEAVKAILLTHGHPDHVAAIKLFPDAKVLALGPDVALVEGLVRAHGPLPRLMPAAPTDVKVAHAFMDGETYTLNQVPVRVFGVPGHTAGSAAYLIDGVLFLGDAGDATGDGTIKQAPWIFSDSQAQDRASLVRLDQILLKDGTDVKAIVFAHSGVLVNGLAPLTAFAQKNQ
jgi:glyoxylase-like metal-dependent hydrolase (beta-lactamase superfamily II)